MRKGWGLSLNLEIHIDNFADASGLGCSLLNCLHIQIQTFKIALKLLALNLDFVRFGIHCLLPGRGTAPAAFLAVILCLGAVLTLGVCSLPGTCRWVFGFNGGRGGILVPQVVVGAREQLLFLSYVWVPWIKLKLLGLALVASTCTHIEAQNFLYLQFQELWHLTPVHENKLLKKKL